MRVIVGVSIRQFSRPPALRGRSSGLLRPRPANAVTNLRACMTTSTPPSLRLCQTTSKRAFQTIHHLPVAMVPKPTTDADIAIGTPRDPNTQSNYHNFVTRNTAARFDIDFEKKVLRGSVVLTLESLTESD